MTGARFRISAQATVASALCVGLAAFLGGCSAREEPPPDQPGTKTRKPAPKAVSRPAAPEQAKCPWLCLSFKSIWHAIHLDVNGKRFASSESKWGGFQTDPTPLKEGTNSLVATFVARKEPFAVSSQLDIAMSPTMIPGKQVPGVQCKADKDFCEYRIEIEMAGGRPGRIHYVRRDWLDEARKKLVWEERVETTATAKEPEKVERRKWTDDGKPVFEIATEKHRIVNARFYKPDGILGAEIKNGTGVKRHWYDNGQVASVTHYSGGHKDGEYLGRDEQGRIRVRGTHVAGRKHGTWTRYDEAAKQVAQSVFEKGWLVKGNDRFDERRAYESGQGNHRVLSGRGARRPSFRNFSSRQVSSATTPGRLSHRSFVS